MKTFIWVPFVRNEMLYGTEFSANWHATAIILLNIILKLAAGYNLAFLRRITKITNFTSFTCHFSASSL